MNIRPLSCCKEPPFGHCLACLQVKTQKDYTLQSVNQKTADDTTIITRWSDYSLDKTTQLVVVPDVDAITNSSATDPLVDKIPFITTATPTNAQSYLDYTWDDSCAVDGIMIVCISNMTLLLLIKGWWGGAGEQ